MKPAERTIWDYEPWSGSVHAHDLHATIVVGEVVKEALA